MSAWTAGILTALALCLAGCREKPAPSAPRSAQQNWQAGLAALAAGQAERAERLFAQSLRQKGDPARRRDVVVQLAVAGRADLSARLLKDQSSPSMRALAEALAAYQARPPRGFAHNAYVIGPMADALLTLHQPARLVAADPVIRLSPDQIGLIWHDWAAWLQLARLDAAEAGPMAGPAGDARRSGPTTAPDGAGPAQGAGSANSFQRADAAGERCMALWGLDGAVGPAGGESPSTQAVAAGRGEAASPARLAKQASATGWVWQQVQTSAGLVTLVHQGSEPIAQAGQSFQLPPGLTGDHPGQLRLFAWRQGGPVALLVLAGQVGPDGLVVRQSCDPAMYQALIDTLADPALFTGRAVPRDARERAEIVRWARLLGKDDRLGADGLALVAASPAGQTGATDSGQWLTDIVSYLRYGRGALGLPGPASSTARGPSPSQPGASLVKPRPAEKR